MQEETTKQYEATQQSGQHQNLMFYAVDKC